MILRLCAKRFRSQDKSSIESTSDRFSDLHQFTTATKHMNDAYSVVSYPPCNVNEAPLESFAKFYESTIDYEAKHRGFMTPKLWSFAKIVHKEFEKHKPIIIRATNTSEAVHVLSNSRIRRRHIAYQNPDRRRRNTFW